MKTYPSIDSNIIHKPCIAFVKYDGSNIRAEWSRKKGWSKFGTRKCLIDENTELYGKAVPLFLNKYGDGLSKVLIQSKDYRGTQNAIVFMEFFGTKSFAGHHHENDTFDVVLFDVNIHKKGFVGPREFVQNFSHLQIAEVVYEGNCGPDLADKVKKEEIDIESKYMIKTSVAEGVICKGGKGNDLWMCKIKTERYLQELKKRFQNWEQYQ